MDPSVTPSASPVGQRGTAEIGDISRRSSRLTSVSSTPNNGSLHGGHLFSWQGKATPVTSPQASTHGGSLFQLLPGPGNWRAAAGDGRNGDGGRSASLPHGEMRPDRSRHGSAHDSDDVWNCGLGRKDDSAVTHLASSSADGSMSGGKAHLYAKPRAKPRAQSVHGGQTFAPTVRVEEPRAHSAHGGIAFPVPVPGSSRSARWRARDWVIRRLHMRRVRKVKREVI